MHKTGSVAFGRQHVEETGHDFDELVETCTAEFCPPAYAVHVDAGTRTVWVRRAEGQRSVGLKLNILERYGATEMIARTKSSLQEETR